MLLEEWVETMMNIVLEIAAGRHLRKDLLHDAFVICKDFFKGVRLKIIAR